MTPDEKLLLSIIEDKARQCRDNLMITNSLFLDMHEKSLVSAFAKRLTDIRILFYGGFADAERCIALMLPDYIQADDEKEIFGYFYENPSDDPLSVIEIEKDRFSPPLSHRDYLGSIMGLGIKREMTGDIIVSNGGCKLAVISKIAPFIAENLNKAGRSSVKAKIIPPSEAREGSEAVGLPDSFTVSSMRLDSVVKNAFSVSRGDACTVIESGMVFVNDIECQKPDKKICAGDKIVFRRKGRIIVTNCSAVSKKGRVIVEIIRFK